MVCEVFGKFRWISWWHQRRSPGKIRGPRTVGTCTEASESCDLSWLSYGIFGRPSRPMSRVGTLPGPRLRARTGTALSQKTGPIAAITWMPKEPIRYACNGIAAGPASRRGRCSPRLPPRFRRMPKASSGRSPSGIGNTGGLGDAFKRGARPIMFPSIFARCNAGRDGGADA